MAEKYLFLLKTAFPENLTAQFWKELRLREAAGSSESVFYSYVENITRSRSSHLKKSKRVESM